MGWGRRSRSGAGTPPRAAYAPEPLASGTRSLNVEAAAHVATLMASRMSTCGVVAIDHAITEAAARHDPDTLAARAAKTRGSWGVRLTHAHPDLAVDQCFYLDATGDHLDLSRFHGLVKRHRPPPRRPPIPRPRPDA